MGKCLFAFPDRVLPNDYYSPVLSGGSWLAALPLTNLQDTSADRMSTLARSSDALAASTVIKGTMGTDRDARLFAICGHNASADATVRLQLYSDDAWTDEVHDTGALPFWSTFYPPGALNWGHPSLWTGAISEEDRNGFKFDFLHVLPTQVVYQSFTVSIVDTANSDGYFELSRCILAPGWQPPINLSFGNGIQWNDPSVINKSRAGRKYPDRRTKFRSITGQLEAMTEAAGVGAWFELQRRLGMTDELYFVFDDEDIYQAQKLRSFLATFKQLDPLQNPYYDNCSAAFALEEVL